MPNRIKVSEDEWVAAAQAAIVRGGVAGVKVDRLAKTLGVTRGGFYHHFENHEALLTALIRRWAAANDLLPPGDDAPGTPEEAAAFLDRLSERMVEETDFSPAFDIAVREWARVDRAVKRFVDKVDEARLTRLAEIFRVLGYEADEAEIRARIYYYHQIGFYTLGHHEQQTKTARRKKAPIYFRLLCGPKYIAARGGEDQA